MTSQNEFFEKIDVPRQTDENKSFKKSDIYES